MVLFINIAGGTASGKTEFARNLLLKLDKAIIISLDIFYKGLTPEQLIDIKNYNFDNPNSLDVDCMINTLNNLRDGKVCTLPEYDFITHQRVDGKVIDGKDYDIFIIEGIFSLVFDNIYSDIKIFVDVDADTRLIRRINRDIRERGRDIDSVLEQYERFVKPSHDEIIEPTKRKADIIVPRGGKNYIATDMVLNYIRSI